MASKTFEEIKLNNALSLVKILSSKNAPRVFSPSYLLDFLNKSQLNSFIPSRRYLTQLLKTWSKVGLVSRVSHGVFINNMIFPKPTLKESAPFIRKNAVISLQKVLGDAGVYNNPTDWVTCVMPTASGISGGILEVNGGVFQFATISKQFFPKENDELFDDAFNVSFGIKEATPEKALLDWLYLASLSNGKAWPYPPLHDMDMDMLDEDVLNVLSVKMGLNNTLDQWLNNQHDNINSNLSKKFKV